MVAPGTPGAGITGAKAVSSSGDDGLLLSHAGPEIEEPDMQEIALSGLCHFDQVGVPS
jgi:hypothetical protein